MSAEDRRRAFDRFWQGPGATRRQQRAGPGHRAPAGGPQRLHPSSCDRPRRPGSTSSSACRPRSGLDAPGNDGPEAVPGRAPVGAARVSLRPALTKSLPGSRLGLNSEPDTCDVPNRATRDLGLRRISASTRYLAAGRWWPAACSPRPWPGPSREGVACQRYRGSGPAGLPSSLSVGSGGRRGDSGDSVDHASPTPLTTPAQVSSAGQRWHAGGVIGRIVTPERPFTASFPALGTTAVLVLSRPQRPARRPWRYCAAQLAAIDSGRQPLPCR